MASAAKIEKHEFADELNVSANPAVKKLLDAIVSILADEYIATAKENPDLFSE
jgi:hypothetical protein